jgi:hypothetical protein
MHSSKPFHSIGIVWGWCKLRECARAAALTIAWPVSFSPLDLCQGGPATAPSTADRLTAEVQSSMNVKHKLKPFVIVIGSVLILALAALTFPC